jgi:Tol biopolymer transport system component/DNA-binding winged helix-turn-helix (wHTH) protein
VTQGNRCYSFGPFRLDLTRGILLCRGARVFVTPRTFDLLVTLVEHGGEVLDKDDLIRLVWHGTIVEENNLARQISSLRKVLGETPGQREYIATVPGVGYQFVAAVAPCDEAVESDHLQIEAPAHPKTWGAKAVVAISGAVVIVAILSTLVVARRRPVPPDSPGVQRSMRQFTFSGGVQQDPAWSPDGRQIAFTSDRSGTTDIWIQGVNDAEPRRLTSSPGREWEPAWSPDGQWIAFRSDVRGGGLYVMAAAGGDARQISNFGDRPQGSPRGDRILFANATVRRGARKLFVVDAMGGVPHEVAADAVGPMIASSWSASVDASWHPDGRRVSIWGRSQGRWTFATVDVDTGDVTYSPIAEAVLRKLEDSRIRLGRFVWAKSANFLYFEGQLNDTKNVWRVAVDPSSLEWMTSPERLTVDVGEETDIALSPDGTRLAFTIQSQRTGVWAFDFNPSAGRLSGTGRAVTEGSAAQVGVDTSPDGSRLAYRSLRAGRNELREISTSSSEDRVLLASADWSPTIPRWSWDGRLLAYSRPTSATRNVVAVLSPGERRERVITLPGEATLRPSDWSIDGTTIVGDCRTAAGESIGICSVPAPDGNNVAPHLKVLVRDPAKHLFGPRLSPDQKWISFVAVDVNGSTNARVYVAPMTSGPWIEITDGQSFGDKPRWSPDGRTLYFVSDTGGHLNIRGRRFDPVEGRAAGTSFPVTTFETSRHGLPSTVTQIEYAIAEHRLFLPVTDREGEIWILDQVDK